jgi:hypothetical protein
VDKKVCSFLGLCEEWLDGNTDMSKCNCGADMLRLTEEIQKLKKEIFQLKEANKNPPFVPVAKIGPPDSQQIIPNSYFLNEHTIYSGQLLVWFGIGVLSVDLIPEVISSILTMLELYFSTRFQTSSHMKSIAGQRTMQVAIICDTARTFISVFLSFYFSTNLISSVRDGALQDSPPAFLVALHAGFRVGEIIKSSGRGWYMHWPWLSLQTAVAIPIAWMFVGIVLYSDDLDNIYNNNNNNNNNNSNNYAHSNWKFWPTPTIWMLSLSASLDLRPFVERLGSLGLTLITRLLNSETFPSTTLFVFHQRLVWILLCLSTVWVFGSSFTLLSTLELLATFLFSGVTFLFVLQSFGSYTIFMSVSRFLAKMDRRLRGK